MRAKTWAAEALSITNVLRHFRRSEGAWDARYSVALRFLVTEEGRNFGREIAVNMTPSEARRYAARLLEQADKVEAGNKEFGYLEVTTAP